MFLSRLHTRSEQRGSVVWPLVGCISTLVGLVLVFTQLLNLKHLSGASDEINSAFALESQLTQRSANENFRLALSTLRQPPALHGLSAEQAYQHGRVALALVPAEKTMDEKISLLCEAFDALITATQRSPLDPKYQVALADVSAQLSTPQNICGENIAPRVTENFSDAHSRLEFVQAFAPYDMVANYLSSITLLGLNHRMEAFERLRRNQEFNPYFNAGQRSYVIQLPRSESELNAVLPRRYPVIAAWINDFSALRPKEFKLWRGVFQQALLESITDLQDRLRDGRLTRDQFARFIRDLADAPLARNSDTVRGTLDRLLAPLYEQDGQYKWAGILVQRSEMSRLDVAKATVADDRDARQSMLSRWQLDSSTQNFQLDRIGSSIGFVMRPGNTLRMLILESEHGPSGLQENQLSVFVSDDNDRYRPADPPPLRQVHVVGDRERVSLVFSRNPPPFVKIHYEGSSTRPRFTNSLDRLIQAYGQGSAAEVPR